MTTEMLGRFHVMVQNICWRSKSICSSTSSFGINSKHELTDYWGTYWLTANIFSDVMSRIRYLLLTAFHHFNDNEKRIARGEKCHDPLFKVRPLLDITDAQYITAYTPEKELSIDESMIKFKGRFLSASTYQQSQQNWE